MQRRTRRAAGPENRQTPWKRPCRTRTIFDARRSARSAYIWRRYEIMETPQTRLPGFEDGDCRNADASGVQPVFRNEPGAGAHGRVLRDGAHDPRIVDRVPEPDGRRAGGKRTRLFAAACAAGPAGACDRAEPVCCHRAVQFAACVVCGVSLVSDFYLCVFRGKSIAGHSRARARCVDWAGVRSGSEHLRPSVCQRAAGAGAAGKAARGKSARTAGDYKLWALPGFKRMRALAREAGF